MNYESMSKEQLQQLLDKMEVETQQLDNLQYTYKIAINAVYGALGSPFFRYFDPALSSAVTLGGQLTNRSIQQMLERNNIPVLYMDTDSVFMHLDHLFIGEEGETSNN